MTALETLHVKVNPDLMDRPYLVHMADGEVFSSQLAAYQTPEIFESGVKEFDRTVDELGVSHPNVWAEERDSLRIRAIAKSDISRHVLQVSALIEPLDSHPRYDPNAEMQYFLAAYKKSRTSPLVEISPEHIVVPNNRIVQLINLLGRSAVQPNTA